MQQSPEFEIEEGEELTVVMGMNWQPGMTKDFALVIWGDSNSPVSITADYSDTETYKRDGWHYLTMMADDQNKA